MLPRAESPHPPPFRRSSISSSRSNTGETISLFREVLDPVRREARDREKYEFLFRMS